MKGLFTNIQKQQNILKISIFLRHLQSSRAHYIYNLHGKVLKNENAKFPDYYFYINTSK